MTNLTKETTDLLTKDLSEMTKGERQQYLTDLCQSLGLNPRTRPFGFLVTKESGGIEKTSLYAFKDATEQLRKLYSISLEQVSASEQSGCFLVAVKAKTPDGREDFATGAVALEKPDGTWEKSHTGKNYFKLNGKMIRYSGDDLANALMKAETKAKRRATLSICGLGILDESEIETIKGAKIIDSDQESGWGQASTRGKIPSAHIVEDSLPGGNLAPIPGDNDLTGQPTQLQIIPLTPGQLEVGEALGLEPEHNPNLSSGNITLNFGKAKGKTWSDFKPETLLKYIQKYGKDEGQIYVDSLMEYIAFRSKA